MLALPGFAPYASAAETGPSILIGEIAWAGSTKSTADEWIELWNRSDEPVSLSGWSLVGAGENNRPIIFGATSTIAARSAFLVSNYAKGDTKSTLDIAPNVVTTTLSLSNSAIKIELRDASDHLVDIAGDGGTPAAGTSLPTKTSMIRVNPLLSGDDEDGWGSATTSLGLVSGVTDLGTPGMCDGCGTAEPVMDPAPPVIEPVPAEPEPTTPVVEPTPTEPIVTPVPSEPTEPPIAEPAPVEPVQTEPAEVSSTEPIVTTPPQTPVEPPAVSEPETPQEPITVETPASEPQISVTTTETLAQPETPVVTTPPQIEQTATPVSTPVVEPEVITPDYDMLRLSELFPNPESGKEWIEVTSLDAEHPISLQGCELHDASGKIFTFTDATIDPVSSAYLTIELASAKLNNGGDTVILYDPQGHLLDAITYGSTEKGEAWARYPSPDGTWLNTTIPTRGAANQKTPDPVPVTPAPVSTPISSPVPTATPTITSSSSSVIPITPLMLDAARRSYETWDGKTTVVTKPLTPAPQVTIKKPKAVGLPTTSTPKASTTKTTNTKTPATKTAAKKTTTKLASSSSNISTPITFDMRTSDTFGNMRVKLTGVVGTPPGLLTNRAFVLFASDGRGLEVRVPASKKLPDAGIILDVVGTLAFTADGIPYLRLATNDSWTVHQSSDVKTSPRIADIIAPGAEDAWSFVQVTGTVASVSGSTVSLDLGDATIDLYFRPAAGYRAKRLVVGDTIVARGVLDTIHDPIRILPRFADDVVIVSHAEKEAGKTAGTNSFSSDLHLPPWMPLGSAAGAVVVAEGAKRAHQYRKRRALEKRLTQTVSPIQSSS